MKRILFCSLAASAVFAMVVSSADAAAPKHHPKSHHDGRAWRHHHGERWVGWHHHHKRGYAHRWDCDNSPDPEAAYVRHLGPDADWANPRNAPHGLGRLYRPDPDTCGPGACRDDPYY